MPFYWKKIKNNNELKFENIFRIYIMDSWFNYNSVSIMLV